MTLLGFQWNAQIVYQAPLSWTLNSVFLVSGNCWHLYSALSGFQLLLSTVFLGFSPSTCALQESAKAWEFVCKYGGSSLSPPHLLPSLWNFPCSVFSFSESPELWFWLPRLLEHVHKGTGKWLYKCGSQQVCFLSFKLWTVFSSCLLLITLQCLPMIGFCMLPWFYSCHCQGQSVVRYCNITGS